MNYVKTLFFSLAILFVLAFGFSPAIRTCAAAGTLFDSQFGLGDKSEGDLKTHWGSGAETDPRIIVANVIRIILGFLGIIFLILILIGGFQWMTAGGNESNVKTAVARIKNAAIGLVIILAALALTQFVIAKITEAV